MNKKTRRILQKADHLLISGRVGTHDHHAAPGSIQGKCALCDHAIWIAPASLPIPADTLICMQCAKSDKEIVAMILKGSFSIMPKQVEEYRAVHGEDPPTQEEVEAYFRAIQRRGEE